MIPTVLSNVRRTCLLVLTLLVSTQVQGDVPAAMFGMGTRLCSYQFAIPTGGDCDTYLPSMEDRFKSTRQELDRLTQQFVQHNMQLMEEIRQLRQQTSTADAEVADITKDLKTLEGMVSTLQVQIHTAGPVHSGLGANSNISPVSDVMLRRLVNDTNQQLTQDMDKVQQDLSSAINAINRDRQTNAVQQSSVDSAFQDELSHQQKDLADAVKRLQQLQQQIAALTPHPAPPTAAAASGLPAGGVPALNVNGLVEQAQSMLKKVESRVSDLEDLLQKDLPQLKGSLTSLQRMTDNHTLMLSDMKLEMDQVEVYEVPQLQQMQQRDYKGIQRLMGILQPLKTQVPGLESDITSLTTQINKLGTDSLDQRVEIQTVKTSISDLDLQLHLVASHLAALVRDQHLTSPFPPSTQPPPTTTFAVPTPRAHH